MQENIKKANEILESVLTMLDSNEWLTQSESNDGIKIETHKYNNSDILCVKANSIVNSQPEKLCDYLWTMKKDLVKYHDPAMTEFDIIYYSDDVKILRQVNKIVYPIKDREIVYFVHKIYKNGGIWLVNFSINHENCPENNKYVRATLNFSIVGFVEEKEKEKEHRKTMVYTIIHMEPNGHIPSFIINMYYWKTAYYIKYWKSI